MSGVEAFLWGILGGATFELLQLYEKLHRSGGWVIWRLWLLFTVVSTSIGGVMAFLVVGNTADHRPLAALFVGLGGNALFPVVGRASFGRLPIIDSGPGIRGRSIRRSKGDLNGGEASQPRRRTAWDGFDWWTADRVRTLFMAGALLVALLTYLQR